jgi:hypothetical protein
MPAGSAPCSGYAHMPPRPIANRVASIGLAMSVWEPLIAVLLALTAPA